MSQVRFRLMISDPSHFIAWGFGAGLIPKIPGSAGTVLALAVYFFLLKDLLLFTYLAVVTVLTIVGIIAAQRSARLLDDADPGCIVIDEIAGMLIALTMLPSKNWLWLLTAFVLFRFFDVVKPWPIGLFDQRLRGGIGIMLDDVAAGILTFALIQLSLPLAASIQQIFSA